MLIKVSADRMLAEDHTESAQTAEAAGSELILTGKCYDLEYHRLSADAFLSQINQDIKTACCSHQGIYAAVCHNKNSKQVRFFTDALGMGRLFYYMDDHVFLISDHTDEIAEAAGVTFHTDYAAWSQFLAFSYILGNRTFFQEIKAARPCSIYTLDIGSWSLKEMKTGMFTDIMQDKDMDFDRAADRMVCLLKDTVTKMLKNSGKKRTVCLLSGGFDSRCIAACLKSIDCKNIETYTSYIDNGNGADEAYFERNAVMQDYLHDVNFETVMHVPFWDFFKKLDLADAIVLDGYAGDRLLRVAGHAAVYMEDGSLAPDFLERFFEKNLSRAPKAGMDRRHYQYLRFLAKQGMEEELRACSQQITLYYMFNRNARNIAYQVWYLNHFADVFTPFADYSVIKTALTIPYKIRSNDDFYRAVKNGMAEGAGSLPSTNDIPARKIERPILFHSEKYKKIMIRELGDYWERIGGVYDVNAIKEIVDKIEEKQWRLDRMVLPFWFYKRWKDTFKDRIANDSLETYFVRNLNTPVIREEKNAVPVRKNQERRNMMNRWLEYIKREAELTAESQIRSRWFKRRPDKMKVLFTMDVEGFHEGPLFVHGIHDLEDSHKAAEQLIFGGKIKNGKTVLETLAADTDVPLTFFVEVYTPILDRERLHKLLSVCGSNENEVALHCHAFGLTQNFLEERGLAFDDYKNEQGFSKILKYGVDTIYHLTGKAPAAYRSGAFQVYPGHFEALKKNGFQVDSSLFYELENQNSLRYHIKNECRMMDGILEAPCTSFYDISERGGVESTRRLDINLVPFERKLECIARNIAAGSEAVIMLMHSWSFSDYYIQTGRYGTLAKRCHYKFSRAGDFTKVFFCVPSRKNKWYKISMVLDCPYYKEKYQGRNSIRYFVRINGEEVFSNYITNPDRDEYVEHAVKAAGHTIEIFIGLECLADEKPWGWGTCARTTIKGIHVSVI